MKKLQVLFVVVVLFLASNIYGQENIVETKSEHPYGIVFNQGSKWEVVPSMMTYIQKMDKAVQAFQGTSLGDYLGLAGYLNKNIGLLTSSCTMTGQAHDELHKWLLPYIDLVDKLSKVKTEKEGALQLQKIRQSFAVFNTFFM